MQVIKVIGCILLYRGLERSRKPELGAEAHGAASTTQTPPPFCALPQSSLTKCLHIEHALQMSSYSESPASTTYSSSDRYEAPLNSFYVDRTIPRSHPNTSPQLARNDSIGLTDGINPAKHTDKIRLRKACDS